MTLRNDLVEHIWERAGEIEESDDSSDSDNPDEFDNFDEDE